MDNKKIGVAPSWQENGKRGRDLRNRRGIKGRKSHRILGMGGYPEKKRTRML